ncbi:MAG: hypothetical protein WCV79_02870 [Candidatus Paceibacterota bacterium]
MKKQKKSTYPRGFMTGILFAIALSIIVTFVRVIYYPVATIPKPEEMPRHSDFELTGFWNSVLKPLVQDGLTDGKLPYKEINERFTKLRDAIVAKTAKPLNFNLIKQYHPADKEIAAGLGIGENGDFEIGLRIPAFIDTFRKLERSGRYDWMEVYKSHVIIVLMHEMEHTTYEGPPPTGIDIKEESRAWADTCLYTIAPLVEKYHVPIYNVEADFYNAWKSASGNPESIVWQQAVNKAYGRLHGVVISN